MEQRGAPPSEEAFAASPAGHDSACCSPSIAIGELPRRPALTVPQILAWADAFRARTGRWPTRKSGPILEAPGENWYQVYRAVQIRRRGLPGGLSFPQLIKERAF